MRAQRCPRVCRRTVEAAGLQVSRLLNPLKGTKSMTRAGRVMNANGASAGRRSETGQGNGPLNAIGNVAAEYLFDHHLARWPHDQWPFFPTQRGQLSKYQKVFSPRLAHAETRIHPDILITHACLPQHNCL